MRIKLKNIILVIVLALIAAELVFIIKGNSHFKMLKSRRARLEEAIELSNRGVGFSKNGEYSKALKLLEKAMALAPGDSLIAKNLSTVYFGFAGSLIGQGKYQQALELTNNAVDFLPNDPAILYMRAESFYYLNQNDSAIACIGKAYAGEPSYPGITARLDELESRCRSEEGLETSQTGYFDIKFEGGENREMADRILFMLEKIRDSQGAQFSWQAQRTISVVLYNDKQFSDITHLASWAGAAFDGKIRVPIANYRNDVGVLEKVLIHEFVHALLFEIGGKKFSGWFNEGLAQYQEGQQADDLVYIPLSDLSGSFIDLDKQDAVNAYRASLSAVSFLVEDNGWDLVKLFINKLGQEEDFPGIFQETFNLSVDQFDQKWKRNINR